MIGIHSFTLNERLFPVPIYKDKNGQSICPVCKTARKEGNFYSPQFCKVSIPKYRIIEPISVEPCKKSNSHTDDTLSLSGVISASDLHINHNYHFQSRINTVYQSIKAFFKLKPS